MITPFLTNRNALVFVRSKNSCHLICLPFQATVSGVASVLVGQAIGLSEGFIVCHGIKVGVLDAGAKPSFIVAIGFG